MTPARFPNSDTPGSQLGCQLPRAYRRLLRPSSALDAKASTIRPSYLVASHTSPTQTQHNKQKQENTSLDLSKQLQRRSRPLSNNQTTPRGPPPPRTPRLHE